MAFLSSVSISGPTLPTAPSTSATSFPASSSNTCSLVPPLNCFSRAPAVSSTRGGRRSWIVGMAPEEEKMTRRSPLDFPIDFHLGVEMLPFMNQRKDKEWERPKPGRRPDIFPQFSPMKTPLPPPMPYDPPEEDEEEEEEKKEEEEGDPETEEPDKPQD